MPTIPDAARLDALLRSMTLAEKIGQLCQLQPQGLDLVERVREGRVGSLLNVTGALAREYQRVAVEESRLGIPLLLGRDVIHGYRTVFPIPLGQAASFDPLTVREAAAAAAREAAADGLHWTFSPMLDIARDPRWGRIAEGHGEDPLLTARLGAAMVEGYQGAGVAACAKHYVGYGAAEGGRDYAQALIPERVLHDVYLPPFEAAVQAGVLTVMSAFHDLDGLPLTAHRPLLTGVLRERWGFDGLVVSDWNSVIELVVHGLARDEADAAREALTAGVDMEMASGSFDAHLARLVDDGRIEEAVIDAAVQRVLTVKARLGLFDAPYGAPTDAPDGVSTEALARRLARESCVLLHNDGALPADASQKVAVIGPLADAAADQLGCWVFDGDVARSRTVLAAMRERLGGAQVRYAPGLPHARSPDRAGFDAALEAARAADWVLLCVGEDAALSGEAHSRAHLDLPGAQQALLEALAATGRPVVVVVLSGRPLVLTPVLPHAAALLLAWHPGSQGGPAIVDLLYGAEPSGRLPVSLPRSVGQIPIHYNHHRTGRPPLADAPSIPSGTPLDPSGFYSAYLDEDHRPLFPFGHGLGFARVEYGPVTLSSPTLALGGSLTASVRLRNPGPREAIETVQLYVHDLAASVTRPVRELKDFRRVAVPAGAEVTVDFVLQSDALAFHGRDGRRVVEPGDHELWLAPDAASGAPVRFAVVDA